MGNDALMKANLAIRLVGLDINRYLVACVLVLVIAFGVQAQNQSHTVTKRYINFKKGQTIAVLSGNAKYARSYVYVFRANSGQMMTVNLVSARRNATFSLIEPDGDTINNAFGVTRWSGKLPSTGEYNIVIVMNNKRVRNISYRLKLAIQD